MKKPSLVIGYWSLAGLEMADDRRPTTHDQEAEL